MAQISWHEVVDQLREQNVLLRETLQDQTLNHKIDCRKYDSQVAKLEQEIGTLKSSQAAFRVNDGAHVVFLINGDDLIFSPIYLSQGAEGGVAAADYLSLAISQHLMKTLDNLKSDIKAHVQVYTNVRKLAQRLKTAAAIDFVATLESFIRGFNGCKHRFDIIDTGSGEVNAMAKIGALLSLHFGNPQCLQVILGIKPNHEHLNKLEEIVKRYSSSSLYLVEYSSDENEFARLRSSTKTINLSAVFHKVFTMASEQSHQALGSEPLTRKSDAPAILSNMDKISLLQSSVNGSQSPEPDISFKFNKSSQMTWAQKAAVATNTPSVHRKIAPLPAPASRTATQPSTSAALVPRNARGQRIDPYYSSTNAERYRMQKLRLCHDYFLLGTCRFGNKCAHLHSLSPKDGGMPDGSLSAHDLRLVALVSRHVPCRDGTACDDINCTFGHRCTKQEDRRNDGWEIKGSLCKSGRNCKFSDDMHVEDLKVVQATAD